MELRDSGVKLRSFRCGTEGCVELRDFGCSKGVVLVLN